LDVFPGTAGFYMLLQCHKCILHNILCLVAGKPQAHQIAEQRLAQYRPQEYLPGPSVGDDDASLAKAAGDIGTTIFHPVGTARMGTASDSAAVVDERLRFHGIAGLRVADASVMPTITSGNTNTPTAMIAEKAAAMILEDGKQQALG